MIILRASMILDLWLLKPALLEIVLLVNLESILEVGLHHRDHLAHRREPHVQYFFHVEEFHLDDVLCVLGEGSAANLLGAQHLHHHLLPRGSCHFLQDLVGLLCLVGVEIPSPRGEGNESHRSEL